MDTPNDMMRRSGGKARLLFLYTDATRAAALVRGLPPAGYEIILCPISVPTGGWMEELRPDLILVEPPSEERQLIETCEAIRPQTERPIMVLSDRGEEPLVLRVLTAGIDEYLVQPVGDRELAARIEALLRRLKRYRGLRDPQQAGDLILSSVDLSVERNERKVFLSPIEFRLLNCLVSAPGRVLTHQTLMSQVWGAEYVDSRHYLRVYIRYLREKIEDDPRNPRLILSEWGVGYRFQPAAPPAR